MAIVVEADPLSLVTEMVYFFDSCTVVGVPVMAPETLSMVSPSGSAGKLMTLDLAAMTFGVMDTGLPLNRLYSVLSNTIPWGFMGVQAEVSLPSLPSVHMRLR